MARDQGHIPLPYQSRRDVSERDGTERRHVRIDLGEAVEPQLALVDLPRPLGQPGVTAQPDESSVVRPARGSTQVPLARSVATLASHRAASALVWNEDGARMTRPPSTL